MRSGIARAKLTGAYEVSLLSGRLIVFTYLNELKNRITQSIYEITLETERREFFERLSGLTPSARKTLMNSFLKLMDYEMIIP